MNSEIIFFIILAIVALGFLIYALYLLSRKYITCDKCGACAMEIGNNYTPECMLHGGYDTFYKCPKCGKTFTVHQYTYD